MNKSLIRLVAFVLIAGMATMTGCKKEEALTIPPEQAHFLGVSSATYAITAPGVTYTVLVGVTTVSQSDRTFAFSVSSPTGAATGTHYTLNKTSVTIPAGKAIDSIKVSGVYDQYVSGRKDTLIFTISEGGKTSEYNSTFKLLMRGPCFEGDVELADFLGTYEKTNEDWGGSGYGPYTTTISGVESTGPTTGTITVTNIFDAGWNPLKFQLDWTDPANRTVTLVTQNAGGNAGQSFGAPYNGKPFGVRPVPAGDVGTFSYCNQTLTLRMQVGIFGIGYSGDLYELKMAR